MDQYVTVGVPLKTLVSQLPDITLARALSIRLSNHSLQRHLRNSRGITPLERELCRFIDDYEDAIHRETA